MSSHQPSHREAQSNGHGEIAFSAEQEAEIVTIIAKYPTMKSAVMPLLWMAQRQWGWISHDVCRLVAKRLELPPSHVLTVATFYTMFKKAPTGEYLLQVCHTLSCALAGADELIEHIEDKLGIKEGETTPDGKFTLMRVECLASCGSGPMMQVNDDFYEGLNDSRVDEVFAAISAGTPPATPRPEVDQWTHTPVS
jgi:NADH-quinone oxidoreductase E subunit